MCVLARRKMLIMMMMMMKMMTCMRILKNDGERVFFIKSSPVYPTSFSYLWKSPAKKTRLADFNSNVGSDPSPAVFIPTFTDTALWWLFCNHTKSYCTFRNEHLEPFSLFLQGIVYFSLSNRRNVFSNLRNAVLIYPFVKFYNLLSIINPLLLSKGRKLNKNKTSR